MISIGYLAGFIDGEGSSTAHSVQKASPSVVIVNTNLDVLDEISSTVENLTDIRTNSRHKWQPKDTNLGGDPTEYKTCYILRLGPPILRKLLPMIIPELRVKKQQAEWMLELISLIPPRSGPHSWGRSTETWSERQELVDKIMWANQGYP